MLVAIRIRPLCDKEIKQEDYDIVRAQDKMLIVLDKVEIACENEGKKPEMLHRSKEQRYHFDRIFDNSYATDQVYENTCKDLIESVMKGYNGCVFAYGTTGSGKTHTMTGNLQNPGINYLMIQDIFNKVQHDENNNYDIKVSYVEIYNEVIRDLLVHNSKNTFLELREDGDKGVNIAGVTEFQVKDPTQVMSLLTIGNKRRTTESTNMNQTSSRSHAIFQIQLEAKDKAKNTEEEVFCGKLSLIDLAGSERGTVTENRGIRLREGAKINTSLLALANCINALGDKTKKGFFVPFRDSKLTRMLKDSLGGNCKTVMIVTISPGSSQNEETINTLKYANRAKNIKMRVEPNKKIVYQHISAYKSIIADLRDEIENLRLQLSQDITGNKPITQPAEVIASIVDEEHLASILESQALMENVQSVTPSAATPVVDKERDEDCRCGIRRVDEEEKVKIQSEINICYEDIIQLEQALIELDEQNTLNALEIRKREAKIFLLSKQLEKFEDETQGKENADADQQNKFSIELNFLKKHMDQHGQQIEILQESTKMNLVKRQSMKNELFESYQQIKEIRQTILQRIESEDIRNYLELIIKNNFLESQNVQLLLNLQLQARTIQDLKNMIGKQQKFIDENDIGTNEKTLDLLLDGGDLDIENDEAIVEGDYISDFPTEDQTKSKAKLSGLQSAK